MGKVIIYCHSYDDHSSVYLYLRSKLLKEMTEPVGARELSIFQLVDMFNACSPPNIKKHILHSFCSMEGVSIDMDMKGVT